MIQNLGACPQGQYMEAVFQMQPLWYLMLVAKLGSVRVTQLQLVLKSCGVVESS